MQGSPAADPSLEPGKDSADVHSANRELHVDGLKQARIQRLQEEDLERDIGCPSAYVAHHFYGPRVRRSCSCGLGIRRGCQRQFLLSVLELACPGFKIGLKHLRETSTEFVAAFSIIGNHCQ